MNFLTWGGCTSWFEIKEYYHQPSLSERRICLAVHENGKEFTNSRKDADPPALSTVAVIGRADGT